MHKKTIILICLTLFAVTAPVRARNRWWNPFEWFRGSSAVNTPRTLATPLDEWSQEEILVEINSISTEINRSSSVNRIKRLEKRREELVKHLKISEPRIKPEEKKTTPTIIAKRMTWKPGSIREQIKKFPTERVYKFYKKRKLDYNYASHNLDRAINTHKVELIEKKINYILNDIAAAMEELQHREDITGVVDRTGYTDFSREWIEKTIDIKKRSAARLRHKAKTAKFLWERKHLAKKAARLEEAAQKLAVYLNEK